MYHSILSSFGLIRLYIPYQSIRIFHLEVQNIIKSVMVMIEKIKRPIHKSNFHIKHQAKTKTPTV